jgi:hypothetical protein
VSSGAPGHRDDAADVEDLEHQRHVARPPPGVPLVASRAGVLADVAREHRAIARELAQDVASQACVLAKELVSHPLRGREPGSPPTHACAEQWEVLGGPDEGVPLEQLAVLPEQTVELGDVERSEAAPEDELLGRRHGGDRIHL